MRTAHRAFRIFPQHQFPEFHPQCIDQEQSTDQRITNTKNELDDLGRLHYAHKTGQDSQDTALGAGWNQPRRWRLRVEAAIARAILGREYAGLSFKTKDRSVHIRLSRQHASVVYQIARGEVIGAIGDKVELAE